MTPERLAEIRGRTEESSKGPWDALPEGGWAVIGSGSDSVIHAYSEHAVCSCGEECDGSPEVAMCIEDIEFIAHARTDVPDLLAEVDRLRNVIADEIRTFQSEWRVEGDAVARERANRLANRLNPKEDS